MGQYDSIKALASGGYTQPAESTFRTNSTLSVPASVTRRPGEPADAYFHRLAAIEQRRELAQQKYEAILQYQKEKQAREEAHEAQIRKENTDMLQARYNALMSNYNPNDLTSLQRARSEIAALKTFYTYNKLNKDFDMFSIGRTGTQTDRRIFNLENGNENSSYVDRPDSGKNFAAFDFQPVGERDILS